MKALMKTKRGYGNMELLHVPEPVCQSDQIKVKVVYAGICGTDLHINHDTFTSSPPVIVGHEFSGIVSEVGESITKVKPGDRVSVLPSNAGTCRKCEYCKIGHYWVCEHRKGLGIGMDGCFTEYVVVQEDMVFKIPDHLSFEFAALAEPIAVVTQAVEELADISLGDTVLVSGPGPIGLLCLLLLKKKGCKVIVTGTQTDAFRLALAKKLGADIVVDVHNENLTEVIQHETQGKGVDAALECAGAQASVNACFAALKKMGKYVQVGIIGKNIELNFDTILYKHLQVYGSGGHSMKTWERVMKILNQNSLELSELITHKYPLNDWKEAFELCENKNCGKVLLFYDE
ncbi:alcohol dehydrogenase catalytic domain-containing protein [Ureibacillus composti]|nr:alcohol dehydrogenase catalytic domain-containing protein [Ureibacillus composti]